MNRETIVAIVRIVLPCVVSVLGVLGITNVFGIDLATVNTEQAAAIIATLAAGVISIFTGWFNNNVTEEAQEAQIYLEELKNGDYDGD